MRISGVADIRFRLDGLVTIAGRSFMRDGKLPEVALGDKVEH